MGVRLANSFLVYAGWLEAITGVAVVLFAVVRRKGQIIIFARSYWKQGALAGILSISAYAAVLWALKTAPLATISALRETSIIFAAIIGALFFKESYGKYRILASCIVVIGIAVLVYNA
jgi:drug/metabolite transporter (DMT)-like permease